MMGWVRRRRFLTEINAHGTVLLSLGIDPQQVVTK